MMKKNETFTATADGYTFEGQGVVHHAGMAFFVPRLIPGETAELSVTALKKNYGYARIVRLLDPSPERREPVCPVYRPCGGCQLMHMSYEEQLRFKQNKVRECFRKNAGMEVEPLPVLSVPPQFNYRNKVQVPAGIRNGRVVTGFYRNHTNEIVPYDACAAQSSLSNEIVAFLRTVLEDSGEVKEVRWIMVKHAHRTGQVMVCFIVRHDVFSNHTDTVEKLVAAFPQIRSVSLIVNNREDNVILSAPEKILYGDAFIEEKLMDCTFRISAQSFYQVNPYATEVLYGTALEYADLQPDKVLVDLYCGTGTIGLLCARKVKKVYGIEIVPDAVRDARVNAEINGINNIEFLTADANKGARILIQNRIRPDVIIVDPPRKGCSRDTLDAIAMMAPERLVYVSCDPATLARDVRIMQDKGYELKQVQPVDMFPNTLHIETVCLLYHQKKDFISVPYEPKNADYLKKDESNEQIEFCGEE